MRIFAIPFEEISCTRDLKRKSEGLFIGVWRSWLAHLVWDQRVQCSSHCTPTDKRSDRNSAAFLLLLIKAIRSLPFQNGLKAVGNGMSHRAVGIAGRKREMA